MRANVDGLRGQANLAQGALRMIDNQDWEEDTQDESPIRGGFEPIRSTRGIEKVLQLLEGKAKFAPDRFNPVCVECGDTGWVERAANWVDRCSCNTAKVKQQRRDEPDLIDELLGG